MSANRRLGWTLLLAAPWAATVHPSNTLAADAAPLPATARVRVVGTRVLSEGLVCRLFSGLLTNETATFDVTLQWTSDGVSVASGEFSCKLRGKTQILGADACRFNVGGGEAKTAIACPADALSGVRDGDGIALNAKACRGVALGCDLAADLQLSVVPK